MLSHKAIEEQVRRTVGENVTKLFFDHEHEAFLWFDDDKNTWCMAFYMVDEDKVHLDPIPTMSFVSSGK